MASETKTFYPGQYEGFSGESSSNLSNPIGKGSSNSRNYAQITASRGSSGALCFWSFDVTTIPLNAKINSVSCKARCRISSSLGEVQLYSGSTPKGSKTEVSGTSTSGVVYTLNAGVWSRAELSSARIRLYIPSSPKGSQSISFYGADLTVSYTYQSEKFMLKLGGNYHGVARVFKKVSGIWVEQESLEGVVDTSKKLVNGGEIN